MICCLCPSSVSCDFFLGCSEKESLKKQDLFPDKQILCQWIQRLSCGVCAILQHRVRWDLRGCKESSNSIYRSDLRCIILKHTENRLLAWLGVALIRYLIVQLISLGSLRQLRAGEVLCPSLSAFVPVVTRAGQGILP